LTTKSIRGGGGREVLGIEDRIPGLIDWDIGEKRGFALTKDGNEVVKKGKKEEYRANTRELQGRPMLEKGLPEGERSGRWKGRERAQCVEIISIWLTQAYYSRGIGRK